jgi:predicted RNase H-like HicB family nuclease
MTKQAARDRFDGYVVELFLDEDNDWLARLVEFTGVSAFGPSPKTALKELDVAWTAAKESFSNRGLDF